MLKIAVFPATPMERTPRSLKRLGREMLVLRLQYETEQWRDH